MSKQKPAHKNACSDPGCPQFICEAARKDLVKPIRDYEMENALAAERDEFARKLTRADFMIAARDNIAREKDQKITVLTSELAELKRPLPCSHLPARVVQGDEGTAYCGMCEANNKIKALTAQVEENDRLATLNAQAYVREKGLREAAESALAVAREAVTKIKRRAAWLQKKLCAYTTPNYCDCKYTQDGEENPSLYAPGHTPKWEGGGEQNGCAELRDIIAWCAALLPAAPVQAEPKGETKP